MILFSKFKSLDKKVKVAGLSVFSNTMLIFLKIIAGILSGSVSIISEAIHSGMDLIAAVIAFFSVRMSSKPADKTHPYGHGKIENISGAIEGLLIFIAAILIIVEAVKKIVHPVHIQEATVAIAVMILSAIVNTVVSRILYKVSRAEDSVALEADALHLKADVFTSAGVGAGLLIIKFTGITILDPIVAILVALFIIKEAWQLTCNAFRPLLDVKLSDEDEEKIRQVLGNYNGLIADFHGLRTRKAGKVKHIDFHITVTGTSTVFEAHTLSDKIERDIEDTLCNTNVNIHIEPDTTTEAGGQT